MADTVFKFECPACGQRISATPDLFGTDGNCPTCGQLFTVPTPPPQSAPPAECAEAAKVRALGYSFTPPADCEVEEIADNLESFLMWADESFEETLRYMEADGQIEEDARPTAAQIIAIGNRILAEMFAGNWNDTEQAVRRIILEIAPQLRA